MLEEAIKSVLAQTMPDFEVIVVNDCGGDLRELISRLDDKRIKYLRNEANQGPTACRNIGIRESIGKYIAYLDDDDIFYPEHLQTLVGFLESGKYKVAYADSYRALQVFDGQKFKIKRRDIVSFEFDPERILIDNAIPIQSVVHEKSVLDKVGSFDKSFRYLEDWELWIRISREYEFAHVKEVTSEFRWRLDGSNRTSSKQMEYVKARERIYEKYKSYAGEKPEILQLQKKTLNSERKQAETGNWAKKERIKLMIIRLVGLKGLDLLYRMKLKLFN